VALWSVATFASGPVRGLIAGTAEQVEVALGLDLAKGAPPQDTTKNKATKK